MGRQLGQCQGKILPVHVDGQISKGRKPAGCAFCIVFAKSDTYAVAEGAQIRLPGFGAVQGNIRASDSQIVHVVERSGAGKDRVVFSEIHKPGREVGECLFLRRIRPVDPGDLIILAISIVVALLRIAALISLPQHGCATGKEKEGQEITDLFSPETENFFIFGLALCSAVPAVVVFSAVQSELSVCFIVALIIGYKIFKSETVIIGDVSQDPMFVGSRKEELEKVLHGIIVALYESAKQILEIITAGDQA